MIEFTSFLIIVFTLLWVFARNKKVKSTLLDETPNTFVDIKVNGNPKEVYKAILKFSQYSDYKIGFVKEEKQQLILNYFPKVGEQTNGAFFPIWVTSESEGNSNVRIGIKDKLIAFNFEKKGALSKLEQALKVALLSEDFSSRSNPQNISREQSSPSSSSSQISNFIGNRELTNDSYKIFLVKKYSIEKNDVLGKYILQDKLFDSIDEVLAYADTLEQDIIDSLKEKDISQNSITEPQSVNKINQPNLIKDVNTGAEVLNQNNSDKILIKILFGVLIIGFIAYFYFKSSTPNNSSSSNLKSSQTIDPNKPYSKLREEIISSGWKIYKRPNEIKGWSNKPYPELDFCSEDYCVASFINQDGSKVREVGFGYCSTDRYIKCPGKPNGFQEVDSDIIISKNDSDNKFLKNKKRFED